MNLLRLGLVGFAFVFITLGGEVSHTSAKGPVDKITISGGRIQRSCAESVCDQGFKRRACELLKKRRYLVRGIKVF